MTLIGKLTQLNKDKVPSVKSFCILMRGFSREMNKASYSLSLEGQRSVLNFCVIKKSSVNMNLMSPQMFLNTCIILQAKAHNGGASIYNKIFTIH